jgi:hypothetical protein
MGCDHTSRYRSFNRRAVGWDSFEQALQYLPEAVKKLYGSLTRSSMYM